jgi:hypothetical protein
MFDTIWWQPRLHLGVVWWFETASGHQLSTW